MLTIQHFEGDERGVFKATENKSDVGEMTYYWEDESRFVIDSTEVDSEQSGRGIGTKLILSAVEFARQHNYKIIPLCPFVLAKFEKMTDIHDVWSR